MKSKKIKLARIKRANPGQPGRGRSGLGLLFTSPHESWKEQLELLFGMADGNGKGQSGEGALLAAGTEADVGEDAEVGWTPVTPLAEDAAGVRVVDVLGRAAHESSSIYSMAEAMEWKSLERSGLKWEPSCLRTVTPKMGSWYMPVPVESSA